MIERIAIAVGVLTLGLALAWAFDRLVGPKQKALALIPLAMPALLWFGLSGQLQEVKAPGGFQVTFAAAARAPVAEFASAGGLRPIFPTAPVLAQVALPAEARYVKPALEGASAAVLRGDVSGRVFYWIRYEGLNPRQLLARIKDAAHEAVGDDAVEYLIFGPDVGVIDCYVMDVDFDLKRETLAKTLKAMAAMPPPQQRALLADADVCQKPLQASTPAIDALERLDRAGHDEALVANTADGYAGIAQRDRIVSALISSLIKALARPESTR